MMSRRAFTLIELLVVIAIIALLVSILLPALASARKAGRKAACMANLQQLGRAHHEYGFDFKNFIAALNGQIETGAVWGGNSFPIETDCGRQVMYLIAQSRGEDLRYTNDFPSAGSGNWNRSNQPVVFQDFSHTVLVQYMSGKLPMPGAACPEDAPRVTWQKHTRESMPSAPYQPVKPHNIAMRTVLPYSSSYQLLPTSWISDGPAPTLPFGGIINGSPNRAQFMIRQGSDHDLYSTDLKHAPFGGRTHDEIAYPAQKVAVADSQQRHAGNTDLFYAYEQARQPLLFWDGSVSERKTGDSNRGWNPHRPSDKNPATAPTFFKYNPDPGFESPHPMADGGKDLPVAGYYKWTRGGLRGVDFGGNEISTKGW